MLCSSQKTTNVTRSKVLLFNNSIAFFWLCRSILHVCECRNWTSYSFDFYNLLLFYGNSVFIQCIEMFTIHTRFPPQTKKECTLFVVDIIVIFDSLYLNLSDNQILVYNRLQRYTYIVNPFFFAHSKWNSFCNTTDTMRVTCPFCLFLHSHTLLACWI